MKPIAFFQILCTAIDTETSELGTHNLGATFVKMLLTFGALILLLFATYWVLKKLIQNRMEKGSSTSKIQILEKRMLSPKTMLYMVEIENKCVLIAESQLEIKKIETLDTFEETP